MIQVNGHYLNQRTTGVQRYVREILKRWSKDDYHLISCESKNAVIKHLWMQTRLRFSIPYDNNVLWSPTNIGPLNVKNQVLTLHDISDFLHPEWFSGYYARMRKFFIPKLINNINKVLTVSEFSRQTIIEEFGLDPSKVKAIYNGVNREHFMPASSESISRIKEKLGLHDYYVLTLGSLDPRKNLKGILQAWSLIKHEQPSFDYQLVVAGGKGKNFSDAFDLTNLNEEDVLYLGYVDDEDLAPLYSGASMFVYPSLFEGFGLPVLEAMSCRTPVLTSNTGALKEISEGAAELVSPSSPEEIAQGILKITGSNDLSKKLTEAGNTRVSQFSWDKCAKETYSYLQQFTS